MSENPFTTMRKCKETIKRLEDDRIILLIILKGFLSVKYLREDIAEFKTTISLNSEKLSKKLFNNNYLISDITFDSNIELTDLEIEELYRIIKKSNYSVHPDIYTILFEIVPEGKIKDYGQVFTPIHITRYILKHADFKISTLTKKNLEELHVIDPSMGYGKFIVEFYHILRKSYEKIGYNQDVHKAIIEKNIFGIDKDPFMVNLSMIYILTLETPKYYIENKLEMNLIQADALLKRNSIDFENLDEKSRLILSDRYDYVLGNPPYSKKFTVNEKKYYINTYKRSIGGHPNLCTLFIHRSIEFLKDNGFLGFIVAAPYTTGTYNTKIRKYILEKTKIVELLLFKDRKKTIRNVLQAFSIIILKKEKTCENYKIKLTEIDDLTSLRNNRMAYTLIDKDRVINDKDHNYMFLISSDRRIYDIIEKVGRDSNRLLDYCEQISTGHIVNYRVKEKITSTKTQGAYPLIDIKNVYPYFIDIEDERYCPLWYIPKTDYDEKIKIENNVILVKRMTSPEQKRRIVAGFTSFENINAYLGNKVNFINLRHSIKINPFFILSLLNSRLFDFYFRRFSSNTQVSANELRLMPIKKEINGDRPKIASIAEKNRQLMEKFVRTKNKDIIIKFTENQRKIDELIYRIYNLNRDEINLIEQSTP